MIKMEGYPLAILNFVVTHWVEWLFALISVLLGWGYKSISARLTYEQKKNEAISEGIQALLRESIVRSYNKYSTKGFCPIYAKESTKKAYKAYAALGGNDVASELYKKILQMPEEVTDCLEKE